MTRPCTGCGLYCCDGQCFLECAADYADAEGEARFTKTLADWAADNPRLVAETRARLLGLPLVEEIGDPMKRRCAA
jgi:hypothetical protein